MRRPVIERRSLTRGTPETHLINAEDRAEFFAARPAAEACPLRAALVAAYRAYADRHGWPEAKGWAAAQAHFDPTAANRTSKRDRAEKAWAKQGRAA